MYSITISNVPKQCTGLFKDFFSECINDQNSSTTLDADSDHTNKKQTGRDEELSSRTELSQTTPAMSNDDEDSEHKISNLFIKAKTFVISTMFVISTANTFSLIVIIKQGLIDSGVWTFIACLSISDNLTIITFYLYEFSKSPVNFFDFLSKTTNFTCKLFISTQYIFGTMSVYFLVFMTCERAVLILRPYRQPTSQKQAIIVVITITILISFSYFAWCFSAFGTLEYPASVLGGDSSEIIKICTILPNYHQYITIYTWIEFTLYYVVPVFLILSSNICIMYTLARRAQNREINRSTCQAKKDVKITRMLIILSLSFVVTISPQALYATILWEYFYESQGVAFAFDNVAYNIGLAFSLLLFNGNFFIYCLSGEMFRGEMIKFLANICCFKGAMKRSNTRSVTRD